MSQPVDFLDIFVRSPGELLYFFTVIAVTLASLFMTLGHRMRHPGDTGTQRYTLGFVGVVLAWVTLMAGAMFALVTDREALQLLPPLERFATVVTILLMIWAFMPPGRSRGGIRDTNLLLLGLLLVLVGYGLTAVRWWDQAGEIDFSISVLGATWTLAICALSILGIILLLGNFGLVIDAPLKMLFFAILAVGNTGTLIQIVQGNIIGDYAGPPRIAFVTALVILPALIFRAIVLRLETDTIDAQAALARRAAEVPVSIPTPVPATERAVVVPPMERESAQLMRSLGIMLENATVETIQQRVISSLIEVLKVDVAALLRMQDANYLDVVFAFDNAHGRTIDGISINLDQQPTIVNAIERQAGRPLLVDRNAEELEDLYTRLDIQRMGPAYVQPMVRDREMIGILLVALPYTNRELRTSEEDLLKGISVIAAGLLALSYAASDSSLSERERAIQAMVQSSGFIDSDVDETDPARRELQNSLKLARQQIGELSKQVMQLKIELDDERSRVISDLGDTDEAMSISQRVVVLREEQMRLQEERDALAERLYEAEAALQSAYAASDDVVFNQIVDSLQREKKSLLDEKRRLEDALKELRQGGKQSDDPREMQTLVESMTAERSRLEDERNRTGEKLDEIMAQLKSLGIEPGPGGLAQVITQLVEQRAVLQKENQLIVAHRDRLLKERTQLEGSMAHETERDERIQNLETQVQNLAGDREAAFKQQEKMRAERDELSDKLEVIKQHRARLLAQNTGYEMELREANDVQRELRGKIEEAENARSELIEQRDRLQAELRAVVTERDQLLARFEGDRERLQQLGTNGVGSLTGMIDELTQQRTKLERELNEKLKIIANLESELETTKRRATMMDGDGARYQPENPALLLGLVQELRTPMTSIIGYVDLLLGESAGILGEMQRKFLQRVSTNVKRLSSMVNDLVHVTELDAGTFPFEPAPVDVTSLIEDAITNASIQFREKGLVINLNLEDGLPYVQGDHDSITQIFGQLLTNAYLVSPPNTEVYVEARAQRFSTSPNSPAVDCLFVSVEDRGGGISPDDEPRVFARKYKAENPLIQGLGDTGVGLSIAKALVEAHGGRLWLQSTENVGTVFHFVIPFTPLTQAEGR